MSEFLFKRFRQQNAERIGANVKPVDIGTSIPRVEVIPLKAVVSGGVKQQLGDGCLLGLVKSILPH